MHKWALSTAVNGATVFPLSDLDHLIHEEDTRASAEGTDLYSDNNRILIVDNDPMVLMLVSKMVLHLGYRPKTAVDGMDALFNLGRSTYNLIITDYDMPFMNGLELANQIKKKQMGAQVIIMTGNHDNDFLNDIETSGLASGLLLKPFNLNTLRETLEMVAHNGTIRWVS